MSTIVNFTTIETILSDLPMVLEMGQIVIFSFIILLIVREFLLSLPKPIDLSYSKNPYYLGQIINIYVASLFFIFIYTVVYRIYLILD
ncbi:MAG: hypothetical protein APF76_12275 [Desulfitibacter sp. BRH_c19]|nr:MAG: hypothetical protein APF76_12275 [Desulfitibacter sp. BRH_c19]